LKKLPSASNTGLARELVQQTPNAPAKTIARRLYAEHPERFNSLETARDSVRYVLGIHGKHSKKSGLCREPRKPGAVFDALPAAKSTFDAEWCATPITGARRSLLLQDIHIPYHDNAALNIAIEEGRRRKCDTIILNGDTADFYTVSDWERDPKHRNFREEVESLKQFLGYLRGKFPKAEIWWKDGNHEERYWRYLRVKAPELWGIEEFSLRSVLHLDDYGVKYVGEMRPILLGKLFVLHGHEYRFPISNPVNPARGLFLRAKALACVGHFHVTSQHSERALDQKVVTCWSIGALCDLHPAYRPLNGWNHGLAIVETDAQGVFHMDNLRIIDGRVY
jgi:predicted phosphodiesterase